MMFVFFFFSSRRRHTRCSRDRSSDVCSSDLYVRSRHNDVNGDFGRSARQQQVLLAIKAKASTLNAADLPDIVDTLKGNFKTSMGLDRVRSLLGVATAFDLANVKQVVLYVPLYASYGQISGQSVILPHWSQILAVTKENFP